MPSAGVTMAAILLIGASGAIVGFLVRRETIFLCSTRSFRYATLSMTCLCVCVGEIEAYRSTMGSRWRLLHLSYILTCRCRCPVSAVVVVFRSCFWASCSLPVLGISTGPAAIIMCRSGLPDARTRSTRTSNEDSRKRVSSTGPHAQ